MNQYGQCNKTCFSGFLLGENINTPGSGFVDKVDVSLRSYLQTIIIKWLFVYISGNKQSIWKWLNNVRQFGRVYCLHTNNFTFQNDQVKLKSVELASKCENQCFNRANVF